MKKSFKFIVAVAATSLVASVAVTPAAHGATKQKVCIALDTAGINDKSFNQSSYEGAKMACGPTFFSGRGGWIEGRCPGSVEPEPGGSEPTKPNGI